MTTARQLCRTHNATANRVTEQSAVRQGEAGVTCQPSHSRDSHREPTRSASPRRFGHALPGYGLRNTGARFPRRRLLIVTSV